MSEAEIQPPCPSITCARTWRASPRPCPRGLPARRTPPVWPSTAPEDFARPDSRPLSNHCRPWSASRDRPSSKSRRRRPCRSRLTLWATASRTPTGGISGELVYVASGGFADYHGKDVTGMITLSELSYAPGRHEKQRIAGLMGSTAQIMMNWGHPESDVVPFGSVKPAWGNPTPHTARTEMPTPAVHRDPADRWAGTQGALRARDRSVSGWRPTSKTPGAMSR